MGQKLLFILWVALLLSAEVFCQARAPKYSNEFLSVGVGARGLAMSNTQAAHVSDVTSTYYNPAGLLGIKDKYQFSLMHAEYFAGIAKYDYAGFATPVDSMSHLAVSVIRFAVDDIPDTRFLYDANGAINYDNIRFFSAADYAFMLSYARKLRQVPGLDLGANFKIVHRSVGNFANAWGFGLDAGAQYRRNKWQFGVMLRDITGTFNAWSHNSELVIDVYTQTGNEIPENSVEITLPKAILGIARRFQLKEKIGLLTALDLDFTFDGKRNVPVSGDLASLDPHIGLEIDYNKIVFLRSGLGKIQQIKTFDQSRETIFQLDFGVGIHIKKITIDYALTDLGDQSDALYSHVFSIKAGLN